MRPVAIPPNSSKKQRNLSLLNVNPSGRSHANLMLINPPSTVGSTIRFQTSGMWRQEGRSWIQARKFNYFACKMKREVTKLRPERDEAIEEKYAPKLVIECFGTQPLPKKKLSVGQCTSEPADGGEQTPHSSVEYSPLHILLNQTP